MCLPHAHLKTHSTGGRPSVSTSIAWVRPEWTLCFFCLFFCFFKFFGLYKHGQSNPWHDLLAELLTQSLHRMTLDLQGRRYRDVWSVLFLLQRNYEYVYTRTGCAQNETNKCEHSLNKESSHFCQACIIPQNTISNLQDDCNEMFWRCACTKKHMCSTVHKPIDIWNWSHDLLFCCNFGFFMMLIRNIRSLKTKKTAFISSLNKEGATGRWNNLISQSVY